LNKSLPCIVISCCPRCVGKRLAHRATVATTVTRKCGGTLRLEQGIHSACNAPRSIFRRALRADVTGEKTWSLPAVIATSFAIASPYHPHLRNGGLCAAGIRSQLSAGSGALALSWARRALQSPSKMGSRTSIRGSNTAPSAASRHPLAL
jgi:hypothetical protein